MTKMRTILIVMLLCPISIYGQSNYWQQKVEYTIDVDMDVNTHRMKGNEIVWYYNNSPDTLKKVFFHLYLNAFQPGSMMDIRSRTISDPDRRVGERILHLKPEEQGYEKIIALKQNRQAVEYFVDGTILEVELHSPIAPKNKTFFTLEFEAQIPLQIRRSGRNSSENVAYSVSQWYPKIAEYDHMGWHTDPYVAREFYGVWGNFSVRILIDSNYVVAASGVLQNATEVGKGYIENSLVNKKNSQAKLLWKFEAKNVHDFMWAADPHYIHDVVTPPNLPTFHFFYKSDTAIIKNWKKLQVDFPKAFSYLNTHFGEYSYPVFSVIQGGDGGMEYPMSTLITGNRKYRSLIEVAIHEAAHSWYQGLLATNESLYPWMDEGFTEYATVFTEHFLFDSLDKASYINPLEAAYKSYFALVASNKQESMITHSDHYSTNFAYSINAYAKGAIFEHQLGYIIGENKLKKGLLKYFNTWKYKHPTPADYLNIMEKTSDIQLDWYYQHFVNSINTIDYGIKYVETQDTTTQVILERIGKMPMPIDILVKYEGGTEEAFYIPLDLMRGIKENENTFLKRNVLIQWNWTHSYYTFIIPKPLKKIISIEIDPSQRMADIDRNNQQYPHTIIHHTQTGTSYERYNEKKE
ncbi:MAG: M1 family metallopeptidase [Chitinophagaceae bacterium]|nr:M1 family metallopeptidase [Chitinophagaceae bacterium]